MKKILTWIVGIVVVFGIIGNIFDDEETSEEPAEEVAAEVEDNSDEIEVEPEEEPEKEPEQEKTTEKEIEINEELLFGEFGVSMNDIRIYEEEGKTFADISFDWLNQAGDGEKMFMSISLLTIYQGEDHLEETTGAWDVENRNSSDVYFPNAQNGEWTIDLTYELNDKDEPLRIVFTPLNEFNEDKQELTIDIN